MMLPPSAAAVLWLLLYFSCQVRKSMAMIRVVLKERQLEMAEHQALKRGSNGEDHLDGSSDESHPELSTEGSLAAPAVLPSSTVS